MKVLKEVIEDFNLHSLNWCNRWYWNSLSNPLPANRKYDTSRLRPYHLWSVRGKQKWWFTLSTSKASGIASKPCHEYRFFACLATTYMIQKPNHLQQFNSIEEKRKKIKDSKKKNDRKKIECLTPMLSSILTTSYMRRRSTPAKSNIYIYFLISIKKP